MMRRRDVLVGAAALPYSRRAWGQAAPRLKIGVLTDLSGSLATDSGQMSVNCVRQAADEFSAATGIGVDVVAGDHQNKPDVGAAIARRWYDVDGVDVIADVPNTAIALAANDITKAKNKVLLATAPASPALIGAQCTPNTIMWTHDAYGIASGVPPLAVKQGYDRWFCIAADYVGSQQVLQYTVDAVKRAGGTVSGTVKHPFPSTGDFGTYLLQAQASGANVLGICTFTTDMMSIIKQAAEFGIKGKMRLVAMLIYVADIKALGLATAQGMQCSVPYYWDLNDRTRSFNDRMKVREPAQIANQAQAGCYAATLHYLKAASAIGIAQAKESGAAVVAAMKQIPTDDDAFGHGTIRLDGRKIQDSFLFEVKAPGESRNPWDLMKLQGTLPADQSIYPSDPSCAMIHL